MKKIFRLSAMVAMLSMMATITTSCEDDRGDLPPGPSFSEEDYIRTFSGEVGGSESTAGSFISIMDGEIYSLSDVKNDAEKASHVEIVFVGDKFFSASESDNPLVSENGCKAVVQMVNKYKKYEFTTNGGENGMCYSGVIKVVEGTIGGASATVKIEVSTTSGVYDTTYLVSVEKRCD